MSDFRNEGGAAVCEPDLLIAQVPRCERLERLNGAHAVDRIAGEAAVLKRFGGFWIMGEGEEQRLSRLEVSRTLRKDVVADVTCRRAAEHHG